MKLKEFKNYMASYFAPEFGVVLSACRTFREVQLVAEACRIAKTSFAEMALKSALYEARMQTSLEGLESRIKHAEKEIEARQFVQARAPEQALEEVSLTGVPVGFQNKIGLIVAIRKASDMALKDAKDLSEDVLDRGLTRVVFKGSPAKAAVAAQVLSEVGGIVERKEVV